jgi:hypothetical protein
MRSLVLLSIFALVLGCSRNASQDPVTAYKNGTLIDCYDRYQVFTPEPTDVSVLLDREDKAIIAVSLPIELHEEVLFLHRVSHTDASFVFLLREEKNGYCASHSVHGSYLFNESLLKKYQ